MAGGPTDRANSYHWFLRRSTRRIRNRGTNNPVQVAGSLVITELNYAPFGSFDASGSNYEFLELQNASPYPYDLSGLQFTDGISLVFDEGSPVLEPEEYVVITRNQEAFTSRYGGRHSSGRRI